MDSGVFKRRRQAVYCHRVEMEGCVLVLVGSALARSSYTPLALDRGARRCQKLPNYGTYQKLPNTVPDGARRCQTVPDGARNYPFSDFLDVDGMAINAHGGGILHFNEIKSGETYLPEANQEWGGTRVNLTGISCYSSQDLLNWKFRGNVLHSVEDNSEHDLYWENVAERPKVIFNAMTGMFVMWLHIDSMDYSKARVGVASSSSPIGPFDYLSSFRPNNQMARDLTVFVDDDDEATAYLLTSSEDNAVMHISQLSDDYLAVRTDLPFHRVFIGRYMEAPTLFKSQGFYYFIGSGCTAWEPNAARSAVAKSIDGPWRELGNPAIGPDSNNTFSSQSTFVLPMDGSNRQGRFIFMADRWVKDDLASSRYVWLPLEFDKDRPIIKWRDKWNPYDLWQDVV